MHSKGKKQQSYNLHKLACIFVLAALPYLVLLVCHLSGASNNNNEVVSSGSSEFAAKFYKVINLRFAFHSCYYEMQLI